MPNNLIAGILMLLAGAFLAGFARKEHYRQKAEKVSNPYLSSKNLSGFYFGILMILLGLSNMFSWLKDLFY